MIVGITGTRKGMTDHQKDRFGELLSEWIEIFPGELILVHGGAIGADTEAHEIGVKLGYEGEVFPTHQNIHNWINRPDVKVLHPPKEPLDRNVDIVLRCEILVATPYEAQEILRSGTWACVRQARKHNKPYAILPPQSRHFQRSHP
jgi:hypothetical protein